MKYIKYLLVLLFVVAGCSSMNTPVPTPHIGPLKLNNSSYVPIPDSNGVTFLNNLNNALSGVTGIEPQFDTYTEATLPAVTQNRVVFCQDCATTQLSCTGGGTGTLAFNTGSAWLCLSATAASGPSGPAGGDLGGSYPNPTVLSVTHVTTGVLGSSNGGAGSVSGALKGNGSGTVSQAACGDLSNGATGCSTVVGTSATQNNPMTTLGDMIYGGVSGIFSRLIGPTVTGTYLVTEVPSGGAATAPTYTLAPYDIGVDFAGTPTASQIIAFTSARVVNFPANFTTPTSQVSCGSNPSETDDYLIKNNGTQIGDVSLTTSCVPTWTTVSGTAKALAVGDHLTFVAPATVSGADIAITLIGTR